MNRLLLGASLLLTSIGTAQVTSEILPYTSENNVVSANIEHRVLTALDLEESIRLDEEFGVENRAGRILEVDLSLENSGTWTDLEGGDRLWELKITAPNALAVNLYFNEYNLPEGATLHIYNEDKSKFLGAFTSKNNKSHGRFATDYHIGTTISLEYFEPADMAGAGSLSIDGVNRIYVLPGDERADACQVDVNCSEGADWVDQRDAVVRLLTKTGGVTGYCTGSLINNTNEDCKNYILTALHCGVGNGVSQPQANEMNDYVIRFNWQRANCGSGGNQAQSLVGADMIAHSNDGGGNSGSDFFLFELQDDIPDNIDAYYAGWDANTSASGEGVSIHHPAGSYKKISTYSSSLVSSNWGSFGSHWRVVWTGTANGHGVTEGGSSGSPIFNSSKRIVGQLTGGSSYCNEVQAGGQNQPDYYGKMSYNWASNPGDDLKDYLAPGSSLKVLDGARKPCVTDINENGSYEPVVSIFPNPVSEYLHINVEQFENVEMSIINELGQLIFNKKLVSNVDLFDASDLDFGVYYITFIKEGKKSVSKFVKAK